MPLLSRRAGGGGFSPFDGTGFFRLASKRRCSAKNSARTFAMRHSVGWQNPMQIRPSSSRLSLHVGQSSRVGHAVHAPTARNRRL